MLEITNPIPEGDLQAAWQRLEASSPLWNALTPSQKSFVVVFLATADLAQSVSFSYQMQDSATAKRFGYQLLKVEKVGEALAIGRGERTGSFDSKRLQVELHRTLAGVDSELRFVSHGTVAAQRLLSQRFSILQALGQIQTPEPLLGAKSVSPSAQPETFSIGEVVRQDGVAYRVTEIDDCGKILTAVDA